MPRVSRPFEERAAAVLELVGQGCPISKACRAHNVDESVVWKYHGSAVAEALSRGKLAKGRFAPGPRREAMALLRASGWSCAQIGAAWGLKRQAVYQILGGEIVDSGGAEGA